MVSIHPGVFVMVGSAVALISYLIAKQKLIVFLFAGILMVIYGLLKGLFKRSRRVKIEQPTHVRASQDSYCPRCRALLTMPQQNFCHVCGQQVIKQF